MKPVGTHSHGIRQSAAGAILLLAVACVVHGCTSPNAPPPPPSGGTSVSLSYTVFVSTVDPILTRQGCDQGGDCHGAGIRGTYALSPETAKDPKFDFDQSVLQVWATMPDSSPILTRPLALSAGGVPHPYKAFASTADSDYQAIRSWIMAAATP